MAHFGLRRIARTRSGTFRVRLPDGERQVVVNLVGQVRSLITSDTDDPLARRLFPTAYHEDRERDREYQALVRDELLDRRLAACATVEETADAEELDEAQLTAWMAAINDVRLVLGTKLDLDADPAPVAPDDPDAPAHAAYDYLGYLLHEIVEALSEALPPPTASGPE